MIKPMPQMNARSRCRTPAVIRQLLGLAFAGSLFAGCDSNPFGNDFGSNPDGVLVQVSLIEVSGNGQVVPSGGIESDPLVVLVTDQDGSPLRGLPVDWRVVRGEGTLSAASSLADADGHAGVTYISGNAPGDAEVMATLSLSSGGAFAGREVPPVPFGRKVNQ